MTVGRGVVRQSPEMLGRTDIDPGVIRRAVLGLAWPSILENLLHASLGFATTLMVARLGAAAVAGVGTSSQLQVVFISAFFAVSLGTTVLIAHAFGAGRIESEGSHIAKQSIVAGSVLAALFTVVIMIFADPLMRLLGADPDVVETGGTFLRWTSVGFIFMAVMFIISGAIRGVGDTRTPMFVTAVMNIFNVALAYLLIFGPGFMPEMGVRGAGLAMTLARFLGAVAMVWVVYKGRGGVSIAGRDGWWPDVTRLKRLADIGLPSMGESVLRSGGQVVFIVVVFMLGTAVTAGNQVAQNAMFLSMFPGFGFSMAATALVGQSLGARNPELARSYGMTAMRWCLLWMSAMGAVFFIFARPIMEFAASGAERDAIIASGVDALRIIAFIQPPLAIGFVIAGILRGAGDTRFPMLSTSVTMWLLRVPLAYLLGVTMGWGLPGIYAGMFLDTVVLGVMNTWRYLKGDWMYRSVLDDVAPVDSEPAVPLLGESESTVKPVAIADG